MSNQPALVTDTDFIAELTATIKMHSFRDPLVEGLLLGELSREGVKLWFMQAAFVVRDFTRIISAIHSNCPYEDGRLLMAENLWEEHGEGLPEREHYTLVKRLIKALGAADEEMESARPLPETTAYVEHCFTVARERSFLEAITSIGFGIEYFMPKFFGIAARSLRENYGLTEYDVEYLTVHIEEDADHANRAIALIRKYSVREADRELAIRSLIETLRVKRRFSESVFTAAQSLPTE